MVATRLSKTELDSGAMAHADFLIACVAVGASA
jgi:hypothetical protein